MLGPSRDESLTSPWARPGPLLKRLLSLRISSPSGHCVPNSPQPCLGGDPAQRTHLLTRLQSGGDGPTFVQVPSLLPQSFSSQQQPEDEGGYLGTFTCQPVWAPVLAGSLASGGALHPNFLIGKLGIQIVPVSHGFERINEYNVTKPQQTGWPSVSQTVSGTTTVPGITAIPGTTAVPGIPAGTELLAGSPITARLEASSRQGD